MLDKYHQLFTKINYYMFDNHRGISKNPEEDNGDGFLCIYHFRNNVLLTLKIGGTFDNTIFKVRYPKNKELILYEGEFNSQLIFDIAIKYCTDKQVVHCKTDDYDVYIGRGLCPKTGNFSMWSNPYSHDPNSIADYYVDSRDKALELFEEYVLSNPKLLVNLHKLKNKVLGCWCKTLKNPNQSCHGDILVRLLDEYYVND